MLLDSERFLSRDKNKSGTCLNKRKGQPSVLKSPGLVVTIANGGDNLSIYVALFANSTWEELGVILTVFFSLVAVWCYAAYRFTQIPALAKLFTQYGSYFVPFVLIGLGIFILIDSHTLENRGLTVITAALIDLFLITFIYHFKNK